MEQQQQRMERMETPLVELTRVLYHLDYFRRNFRHLSWHKCNNNVESLQGNPCVVCSFKSLFTELSLLMREPVLDPPHIHHVIEANIEEINWKGIGKLKKISGSGVAHAVIYEAVVRQIEEGSGYTPGSGSPPLSPTLKEQPSTGIQLHTEFNVTKICLQCRTTNYVESISQYAMQIDSSTLLSNDWPSFEFAIKTALDSEEFCVQPNCHGQTKVFRLLNTLPSILPISFTDPTPGSLITLLPTRLRPHLIFETSKSIADLHLKAVILYSPQWGYATLFHHSRLDLWIFMDSRRVLSLYRTWIESRFHPITYGFLVYYCFYCKEEQSSISELVPMNPPILPTKFSAPQPHRVDNSLAKPPLFESDHRIYERIYENWPLDADSGQGSEFSSNCSSSASASYTRSPSSSFYNRDRSTIYIAPKPMIIHETVETPSLEEMMKGNHNKYATVRRKVKYQRRGGSKNAPNPPSLSLSVPDLTALNSVPLASSMRRASPAFETSSRQSVDSGNRKVSFACEVTLVDDLDEEYIPHPIFQSVLQKLQQSNLSNQSNLKVDS